MKISVITVTYNSAKTLRDTMESVLQQDYSDIEHILVDGLSKDDTVKIIQSYPHVSNFISEKDKGLWDAMNKGIKMSRGEVVGILNSDDFFPDPLVLSRVAEAFNDPVVDAVFGDVSYVNPANLGRVVRHYSSKKFNREKFAYGYMPAHPSFYVRKKWFEQLGYYKTDYHIAADFELLARFIYRFGIKYTYIPATLVHMRTGGLSNRSLWNRYLLNKDIMRACKENGIPTSLARISLRYTSKVWEFVRPETKAKKIN